jgi:hypothetical protein
MGHFFSEIWDEADDFFEDIFEGIFNKQPRKEVPKKIAVVNGVETAVRPAYLFAERLDNLLKLIFGISIVVSGCTATFLGFTKLSDLLDTLISTVPGRIIMVMIGLSYFILALWKLARLKEYK